MYLICLVLAAQSLSIASASIVAPAAGATEAAVHVSIQNPTMYDVYIMSGTTDAAEAVELREPDGSGGTRPASSLTASAYGSIEMGNEGPHLLLKNLKRPLSTGDTVIVTLATDGGERLRVEAVVK